MDDFSIGNLHCQCYRAKECNGRIAYILYPMSGVLDNILQPLVGKYGVTIVVVTGMDWQNVFSPWPAKGVPAGSDDFKGEAPEFLSMLRHDIIPQVESALGVGTDPERTLIGVSMSGLFALWQWMECETFQNIASLSGSFWYENFMEWIMSRTIPHKSGTAFFLLGNRESKSHIKAFDSVADNTSEIINLLKKNGINVIFESVPGNHYSHPIPRLLAAFSALYAPPRDSI